MARKPVAPAPLSLETLEDRSVPATDFVTQVNEAVLDAIRAEKTAPPKAARDLAIVHIAIQDAVNSIDRDAAPILAQVDANFSASKQAAVAQAGHDAAVALFGPAADAEFDALLVQQLAAVADGAAENEGVAVGRAIAAAVLAARATDGANVVLPPDTGATGVGVWRSTPPGNLPGLLPQWPGVTPFVMASADQFRPPAPPALDSKQYAGDFAEVQQIGQDTSTVRSAERTAIAKFWANGPGTSTPPGHWNVIAGLVSEQQGLSLEENAELFATLNAALADAGINSWDAKYHYDFWRPITAIREAADDNNPLTVADPAWNPLLTTPPFSSYTSGHSTFSGAGAAALAAYFGTDDVAFTLPSEDATVADRNFVKFSQAANESGKSRIYGGIHFEFDNSAGLAAGKAIGELAAAKLLTKLPDTGVPGAILPPAPEAPAAPLAGAADTTFVRGLYLSLLGRDGEAGALAAYVGRLAAGETRQSVAAEFLHSEEFARRAVTQMYRQFLNREPDANGFAAYAQQLRDGRALDELAAAVLSSPEYLATLKLSGVRSEAYVKALHYDVAGVVADSVALAQLPANTEEARDLALRLLRKGATGQHRVNVLYGSLLGRNADAAAAGYHQRLADGEDILDVAVELAASPEFARRWQA